MLLLFVGAAVSPVRAADPVQRVETRVVIEDGEPHPLVVRRITESVGSAATRLLVGRDSDLVARQEASLAAVLREVVDRVVGGYRVVEVGLQVGVVTGVLLRMQPRPPVLGELPTALVMPAVHGEVQPLVRAALDRQMPELRRLTDRLPLAALEWAAPILEQRAAEIVAAAAPGFGGAARIEVAPERLTITVTAREGRVIRDIGVRFRSTSIPYVLLSGHAPQVASMAEPLRGLPVVFAAAHRADLEALIKRHLDAYPPVRDYAVVARPLLQVAEVTFITVLAESTVYRSRLEARLNFGTTAPPPDVRATLGRAFGSLEPFVEFTVVPSNLAFRTVLGVRFELGANLSVGATTGFDGEGLAPFLTYRLSPDFTLHGRYTSRPDVFEGTIAYRLNEFLSWEGVVTSNGFVWLRLVSNL